MALTSILRAPLLLAAMFFDSVANAFRAMAWLIKIPPLSQVGKGSADIMPIGYWRCTHSTGHFERSFEPGRIYRATNMPVETSSIRIIPSDYHLWAPYWDHNAKRFCYPAEDLDFEYLGPSIPDGETCVSSYKPKAT